MILVSVFTLFHCGKTMRVHICNAGFNSILNMFETVRVTIGQAITTFVNNKGYERAINPRCECLTQKKGQKQKRS